MTDTDGPTTGGVEWEYMIARGFENQADPQPDYHGPRGLVPIRSGAFETATIERAVLDAVRGVLVERLGKDVLAHHMWTKERESGQWRKGYVVKPESDLWPTTVGEGALSTTPAWTGVEVASQIFFYDDAAAYKRELRDVTAVLRGFGRVVVNATCGLHVHVGVLGGGGYSVLTLKKLATLLWLAEGRLAGLSARGRRNVQSVMDLALHSRLAAGEVPRGEVTGDESQYEGWLLPALDEAKGGVADTKVAEAMADYQGLEAKMRLLWCAGDRRQLVKLLRSKGQTSRRLAYNFNKLACDAVALDDDREDLTTGRTVEFRRMGGTLNGGLVAAWATLCCQLVEKAKTADEAGFQGLVSHLLQSEDAYDVWAFLRHLGGSLTEDEIGVLREYVGRGHRSPLDQVGKHGFIDDEGRLALDSNAYIKHVDC